MAKRGAPGDPVHPGAYVRGHVFPTGMTVTKAAKLLGIGRPALSNFLNGKAALSQEMARRLEHAFGANREEILDLQARYDRRDEAMRTSVVAGRHAPTLVEIKAHQIEKWADTIRAREDLPALLRRLVITTGGKLTRIDFPAFDNAQRRGWDGEVVGATPTPWVPEGRSVWEVSCDGNPERKANKKDYLKRTNALPPDERRDTTFVFVTPRNWQGKGGWVAEKAALGEWRDVRAYDASDLEQWLEQSAETQVWFAERLGEPVSGFRSPDRCWSRWADACEPALSPSMFSVAEGSSADLKRWLDAPPTRPFLISADSPDEALAFACHLVQEMKSTADNSGTGAIVFETPEALQRFRASNTVPRIAIVHKAQVEREIGDLYRRCHCIIVRPAANDVEGTPDIRLGLPGWKDFSDALEAMGISDDRIDRLARESGRSPAVLRRRLSSVPAVRVPNWAGDAQTARKLLPAALIGVWRNTSPADREVVRRLARTDDDHDVESGVMELLGLPDSPLWSTGEYRGVVSRIDALFGIARFVTGADLEDFFSAAERVLSEPDPALELPEDERWAAAVHGKVRDHSVALREGIRQTLVLLSVHGDTLFRNRLDDDFEVLVSSFIRRLLTPLTLDRLLSHLDDLPDYAEAAPDTFLKLLEADLQRSQPAVIDLLNPVERDPFGGGQPRTGLLWALEGLGWRHLGRVAAILARLSTIPIDDNLANRPIASLEALYRSWLPRTSASLAERMQSLESLTKRFPDVGWHVCIAQLSAGPQFALPSHRPRWRDEASGAGRGVTLEQFHEFRKKALDLVLHWKDHDQRMLRDLVELLHDLPDEYQIKIWDLIDTWADAKADDRAKARLRERIRRFALTRRGRRRGVQGKALDRARAAYERLKPRDLLARHAWLFVNFWVEPSADEVEEEDLDHERWAETIRGLRSSAIREIWSERGIEGVAAILADCAVPGVVGEALGVSIADADARVAFLRQCLSVSADPERHMDLCIHGFLDSIEDDARGTLLATVSQDAGTDRTARLFRCAPFRQQTWRLLDRYDRDVRGRYWKEAMPDWNRYTEAELLESVDRLLDAKRPRAAFFLAHLDWSKIDTQQLKRLLLDLGTVDAEPADHYPPESYQISEAMRELDSRGGVDRAEMVRLEFMYMQALDHSEYGIPNLERWVSDAPIGFVRILALMFKREDGGQDPPEWHGADADNRAALASAAYRLLERICRIPGAEDSGDIDEAGLSRWISEARRLCTQYGRARIGDQYIGQILARGPADDHGVRPCLAISEAMEVIASQDIATGFVMGTINARGVFSRAIGEGGEQERELAEGYRGWAKQRSAKFPYVGSILDSIAADYDGQAARQDDEAEIERRLGH